MTNVALRNLLARTDDPYERHRILLEESRIRLRWSGKWNQRALAEIIEENRLRETGGH